MENQQGYTYKSTAYRSIMTLYNIAIQLQNKTGNINTNNKTKAYNKLN